MFVYYFLVIFAKNSTDSKKYNPKEIWYLGEPFYKKYPFTIDFDDKTLGFYIKEKIHENIAKKYYSNNNSNKSIKEINQDTKSNYSVQSNSSIQSIKSMLNLINTGGKSSDEFSFREIKFCLFNDLLYFNKEEYMQDHILHKVEQHHMQGQDHNLLLEDTYQHRPLELQRLELLHPFQIQV